MTSRQLLIIEDDPGLRSQMRWCFDDMDVLTAGSQAEALKVLDKHTPQVVTLDLGLPPDAGGTSAGFELLDSIRQRLPMTKVIVVTGREEHDNAVRAVANGAYDFYYKPIDAETLSFVVTRAQRLWALEDENRRLQRSQSRGIDGMVAGHTSMAKVCQLVERVAPTDASVLILGETGTGKELVAQAVHNLSERSAAPFVAINCAAIPETLLESELFGYEKGAFTGAAGRKVGKIEGAHGGTLFLDEIGDMPLSLQAKILRCLQERTIERLGAKRSIDVDVRVVAATHKPLETLIEQREFRDDLYFRLSEINIQVPPLRERGNDVLTLAKVLVDRFAAGKRLNLGDDAKAALTQWHWPGNVRELENRMKRACIMCDGQLIRAADLELEASASDQPVDLNLRQIRDEAERGAVVAALQRSEHNLAQAARMLGISRPTLYDLLAKHELHVPKHAGKEREASTG